MFIYQISKMKLCYFLKDPLFMEMWRFCRLPGKYLWVPTVLRSIKPSLIFPLFQKHPKSQLLSDLKLRYSYSLKIRPKITMSWEINPRLICLLKYSHFFSQILFRCTLKLWLYMLYIYFIHQESIKTKKNIKSKGDLKINLFLQLNPVSHYSENWAFYKYFRFTSSNRSL